MYLQIFDPYLKLMGLLRDSVAERFSNNCEPQTENQSGLYEADGIGVLTANFSPV